MFKKILALVFAFMIVTMPVHAAMEASAWKTAGGSYGEQVWGKLGFGLTNLLLGWTELFTEPYDAGAEDKNIAAGIGEGLINLVADTVGGALHTVTFFIPQIDVPLPEGGTNILER